MIGTITLAQLASGLLNMPCADLASLELERAAITSAELVAAGPFTVPSFGPAPGENPPVDLPAHCRVELVLTPTPDSNINAELWLPVEDWTGKFLAVGNGGWAGRIQGYRDMVEGLRRGYATAGTDTGHSDADGPAGMFALGHPEKLVDFAYRALHDMTVKSKRVIAAFYRPQLDYAYYTGCSTGGRMGVMAAQRYPGDYDGIIAGALANRHIHMHTAGVARTIELSRHPERATPKPVAELVNEAVMKQCDTLREGFLNNPKACAFDFSALVCHGQEDGQCLTKAQLETVEAYYGGLYTSDGELVWSGQALGNPLPPLPSTNQTPNPFAFDTVRILGFQDPDYDWREFDLDRDLPRIDAAAGFVDAVDPDLRAFEAHGGKLLLYHGWRDTGITPENTILYYESVLDEMGPKQDEWMRLFMVPGMGHCRGGPGVDTFDALGALEQWREQGEAPDEMLATSEGNGLARPLCPYPQYAEYDGSGDLADASSWRCAAP